MGVGVWVEVASVASGPFTTADGHQNQLVYDASQDLALIFQGPQTWMWDGGTWTQLATTPNAGTPVLCYDEGNSQIVMFDGAPSSSPTFNKTRIWDWGTSSWTLLTPATSPSSRLQPGIAYDGSNGYVLMFGGSTTTGFAGAVSETWTWDGTTWAQLTPATTPTARAGFSMAYDADRGEVVMFGGRSVTNTLLADTWTWDGTDWTLLSPGTSPPAKERFGMSWDPFLAGVALYGGTETVDAFTNDTWLWDGSDWTDMTSTVNDAGVPPPETFYPGMCYFASRDELTMVSSRITGGTTDGDTWVLAHTSGRSYVQVMRWH